MRNIRKQINDSAKAAAASAADRAKMEHLKSICDGIGSAVKMLTDDISVRTTRAPSDPNDNTIGPDQKKIFLRKAQELSNMLRTDLPQIIKILGEQRRL